MQHRELSLLLSDDLEGRHGQWEGGDICLHIAWRLLSSQPLIMVVITVGSAEKVANAGAGVLGISN